MVDLPKDQNKNKNQGKRAPTSFEKTEKSTSRSKGQASARGNGSAQSTSDLMSAQVRTRRSRFMIASRQAAGVQTLSADNILDVLRDIPDIEIVKSIDAPRMLGLQSLDGSVAGVVVAKMEDSKAELLDASAQGRIHVERDELLSFALDAGVQRPGMINPGVFAASGAGFTVSFEVKGPDGPLENAEVHLFGSLFPAIGQTDNSGKITLNVTGETPDSIRSLYVKPHVDCWDLWIDDPEISLDRVNTIVLRPLELPRVSPDRPRPLGWGQVAMGMERVPATMDGRGVKVAVIDSGVAQKTHRNLKDIGPGSNFTDGDQSDWTVDLIGHGSHCAGVIGGSVTDNNGLMGFAPAAEVHAVRVFPGGRFSDLVSALDYCMENGVDIASMSLGGGSGSQILADRIAQARSMGVACIVAAGNSASSVQFPAYLPSTMAVSAIGKYGEFPADSFHSHQVLEGFNDTQGFFPAGFSCFGPEIDVCAPGVAITSAVPDDGFAAWDGTSMATPHVAGLAALVYAHHPDFQSTFRTRNNERVDRLFDLIRSSCMPLPFGDQRVGQGLPWAPRALGLESLETYVTGGVSNESISALIRLIQMLRT